MKNIFELKPMFQISNFLCEIIPAAPFVENINCWSKAYKRIVVKVDDTKMIPLSYTRLAIQKSPGWTPVMICTCLALVIRSMSGNTKKTEMKRPIDKVNEFEYLKDVGSTNSSPTTSVNFTSSALGNGWLVTIKHPHRQDNSEPYAKVVY